MGFFSVMKNYQDPSGALYSYSYDFNFQEIWRYCTGGAHGYSAYLVNLGQMGPVPIYTLQPYWNPGQFLRSTYSAGRRMQVDDLAQGMTTRLDYDNEDALTMRAIYPGSQT